MRLTIAAPRLFIKRNIAAFCRLPSPKVLDCGVTPLVYNNWLNLLINSVACLHLWCQKPCLMIHHTNVRTGHSSHYVILKLVLLKLMLSKVIWARYGLYLALRLPLYLIPLKFNTFKISYVKIYLLINFLYCHYLFYTYCRGHWWSTLLLRL